MTPKWQRLLPVHLQPLHALAALLLILVPWRGVFAASLVYIRNGNVWIASPDGSIQRPVTADGTPAAPYYSPSQADDGTIVAGWGSRLYRMNQSGALLGPAIPTLVSEKPPNVYAVGPFNPRVSPDGNTVAYWIGLASGSYDPGCNCILTYPVESVVYARSDGTGTIGFSRFWQTPSWIDSTQLLVFAPDNRQTPQVGVASLEHLGAELGWFNDDGEGFEGYWQNLDDGEMDRTHNKLVLVRGMQAERLSFYATNQFPERPVLVCEGSNPSGAFAGPTWSPDGMAVAWYENDGVWTSPVPLDLTVPGACEQFDPQLLVAGATEPRWGVADVTAENPTTTASRTRTPTPTPSPGHTDTPLPTATSPAAATPTASQTPTSTATATPTPTATGPTLASPTPITATPPAAECPGDCGDDGEVTVDEILRGVSIALGNETIESCLRFDLNGDDAVTVDEILRAVGAALDGCSA